jgi:integrase/recombinase XerD
MIAPIPFGIIFVAPTTWSTTIMPQCLQTCIDLYLDSFAESFAAENYTTGTINTYRSILRKVGHVMDVKGISPSALTLDMAEFCSMQRWNAGRRSSAANVTAATGPRES